MKTLVFNGWAAGCETWDLCTFARDVLFDYLEELDGRPARVMAETDRAVLVGFSMGGAVALETALAFPEKVAGLVLVSATARMTEDLATGWKGLSPHRRAALRLGTEIAFRGNPSPLYDLANLDRGLAYLDRTDLRAPLRALAGTRSPLLSVPVRILQSERDGIVRPHNAAFLKEIFPQAVVTMVPGNEHVVPAIAPELVSAAVEEVCAAANMVY